MDAERARQLLAAERSKSRRRSPPLEREGPEEGDERREPGDFNSEGLYQDEFDAGRAQELKDRLAAVERAEARLADGHLRPLGAQRRADSRRAPRGQPDRRADRRRAGPQRRA